MSEAIRLVAVVGPTAAGKTELGIALAERFNGEVVSVDSMQIYRWMDIGTAKPSPDQLSAVPHHLIDIINPDQEYNAGLFATDADRVIQQLVRERKTAILVGGTGLYLRALIHGIIVVPPVPQHIREEVRTMMAEQGVNACHQRLAELDPQSARQLHPNDISRVSRALEIVLATGNSIQRYQEHHRFRQQRYQVVYLGSTWPREDLYQRINKRVCRMVEEGLLDETRSLLDRGYDERYPAMNAIGYKQAVACIRGKMSQTAMIADIQQKSRHYAKKQLTWFGKNPDIRWLENNHLSQGEIDSVARFLLH